MKCPEVMPNVENLSLRHLHKTHLIQTATLRFHFFLSFSMFIFLARKSTINFMHWKSAGSLRGGMQLRRLLLDHWPPSSAAPVEFLASLELFSLRQIKTCKDT